MSAAAIRSAAVSTALVRRKVPSFSPRQIPTPVLQEFPSSLRTSCCCCQSGGDSWLPTCSQKYFTWHLLTQKGRKLELKSFCYNFIPLLSINETSHSEHWENLGIQWQKSQESIEKGKCFCYLCQNDRANFGFITPPPVTFHWASLSRGWVRSAGVDILLF